MYIRSMISRLDFRSQVVDDDETGKDGLYKPIVKGVTAVGRQPPAKLEYA